MPDARCNPRLLLESASIDAGPALPASQHLDGDETREPAIGHEPSEVDGRHPAAGERLEDDVAAHAALDHVRMITQPAPRPPSGWTARVPVAPGTRSPSRRRRCPRHASATSAKRVERY